LIEIRADPRIRKNICLVVVEKLSEKELCQQAVQALSDKLGPVDALRFLALVSREPFDYQVWRRDYLSGYDVNGLLEEVRKHHTPKAP
jgi:hypothetical protein